MENLDNILEKNRFEVDNLFRIYKVRGENDLEKIHDGYQSQGDIFMVKLMGIITPKNENKFDPTALESKLPDPYVAGLSTTIAADAAPVGKGWAAWNNFLTAFGNTAKTVGTAISDIKTPINQSSPEVIQQQNALAAQDASTTKYLYVGAAVFIAVILIILVTKK